MELSAWGHTIIWNTVGTQLEHSCDDTLSATIFNLIICYTSFQLLHYLTNYTMRCFLRNTLLLLASAAAISADAASDAMDAHVQDMVAWLRDQGGSFNEKLQIRRADPSDPTSYFGVFATESIPSMESLMSVPASSMIRSIQQEYHTWEEEYDVLCDLTHVLLKELKLGEKSYFAPYVKYLLGQERGQIPATWTEPGKELLREVFDPSAAKIRMTDWIEMYFEHEDWCIEAGNAFEQQALAMVVQRGWDCVLIPIYDMLNHVNDVEKLNTDNNSVYSTEGLRVWASKTIEAGEELFLTYDNCSDCQGNPADWGTKELLRDFGFVESYPRKFNFWVGDGQILFAIDEEEEDGEIFTYLSWRNGESPSSEQIKWMEEEYMRLVDLEDYGVLAERRLLLMPDKEWNTILQYHEALTEALDAAIRTAILLDDLEEGADDEDDDIDNITFDSIVVAAEDDSIDEVDDITDDREKTNIDEACPRTLSVNEEYFYSVNPEYFYW
jgi:hypothetical protein